MKKMAPYMTHMYFKDSKAYSALKNYHYNAGEYSSLDQKMNVFWFKAESYIPEVHSIQIIINKISI